MIPVLLHELFPEGGQTKPLISSFIFFERLAAELDSYYFAQIKRYLDSQRPASAAIVHPQNDDDGERPF